MTKPAAGFSILHDTLDDGRKTVVLWQESTLTAAAYAPVAEKRKPTDKLGEEGELIESRDVQLVSTGLAPAPFQDEKSNSFFDVLGRCVQGDLKGWTLRPYDSVMVKWFAWAGEHPGTTIFGEKKEPAKATKKASDAIKEIAGAAEFLR